jgi:hypothetical protein
MLAQLHIRQASLEIKESPGGAASKDPEDDFEAPYTVQDGENHLTMDFLTYCMLVLANKDPKAMANDTLFSTMVNQVYQTFFQYFVSAYNTLENPSYAYQRVGAKLPADIGTRIVIDFDNARMQVGEPITYPDSQTNSTTEATVLREVEVLMLNKVATGLCIGVLGLLILFTIVFACIQRSFLRPLHRNVECVADVMVLLAGSKRLLALVGKLEGEEFEAVADKRLRLGWFKTRDGEVRWGIELVGDDEVEWVEMPTEMLGRLHGQ